MRVTKISKKINVASKYWPPYFVGGGETSTYNTCKQLEKIGYKITIITPNPSNNNEFKFVKTTNPHWLNELFEEKYFQKISIEENLPEDIFWASDFYGTAFLSNKKVRKIATVRDHWPLCYNSLNLLEDYSACDGCNFNNVLRHYGISGSRFDKKLSRTFKALYNRKFRKSILSKFDNVVFVSNYIAGKITSVIPIKNYSVIYDSIASDFLREEGLKNFTNKNMLFLGNVRRYKGIEVLLNAMKMLVSYDKQFNLVIIGEGNLDIYRNMVNKLKLSKNIKFLGKIKNEETIKYYDQSDIVIAPSLCFETFGLTIVEGMARKCIPIATNQGGPREIIKNGKNGFLFEKGNHEQLAQIIIDLYKTPNRMKRIQEEDRGFAIANFSPEKIAKNYDSLFKNLL